MKIDKRKAGNVTVLELDGKITIGAGDVRLREAVHEALGEGRQHLLLDMSRVTSMDSAGVGELVAAYASARNRGAQLKLLKLSPKVAAVLQITQIHGVLPIFNDEEEALASF